MMMSRREYPEPRNVRDLNLMYETCGRIDGGIEFASFGNEVKDGNIGSMELRVVPDTYGDDVTVMVRRMQYTNVRKSPSGGHSYTPHYIVDWKKTYTFEEFRESPFFDMVMDVWGKHCRTSWDTRLMDERECGSEERSSWVSHPFYEHETDWLGNWRKTGKVRKCGFEVFDDGICEISLDGDRVYRGDFQKLVDIIDEHEEMRKKLNNLREHGIDLDGGTLSIKLWED